MNRPNDIERRIHRWLCGEITRNIDHARAGCFIAGFDPASRHPFLNYAVPIEDADPASDDIGEIERMFRERNCSPHLEYIAAAAPRAEAALKSAGFAMDDRIAVMVWQPGGSEAAQLDAFEVYLVADDQAVANAAQVQSIAFGGAEEATLRLCALVAGGGLIAVASEPESNIIVAVGTARPPSDGVTEIAGIGVISQFRRRGIATILATRLAQESRARGADLVWLTPSDGPTERVYARAGFVRVCEQLHMSKRNPA